MSHETAPPANGVRRVIRISLLSLLLGVLTTVAVAWALAAWLAHKDLLETYYEIEDSHPPATADWTTVDMSIDEFSRPGMCRRLWGRFILSTSPTWDAATPVMHYIWKLGLQTTAQEPSSGTLRSGLPWGKRPPIDVGAIEGVQDARGWPMLCLWGELQLAPGDPIGLKTPGAIPLSPPLPSPDLSDARALPLRPIPRGFAIDTAFYAAIWLPLLIAPRAIRRHRRARRGLCPNCAYDLRTLPATSPCPECAHPNPRLPPCPSV